MPRTKGRTRRSNGVREQAIEASYDFNAPYSSATALHDKNASVACVRVDRLGDYSFTATGSAKRAKGDVHDEVTAEMLALARAFQDLSRQLESEARKRVRAATAARTTARKARIAEKHAKAVTPARHRTLAEWQEIQARSQRAQNAVLARNLGFVVDEDDLTAAYVPRHGISRGQGGDPILPV